MNTFIPRSINTLKSLKNLAASSYPMLRTSHYSISTQLGSSSVPGFSTNSYKLRAPINWGVHIVPEKRAYVVERFGKYLTTLDPGLHFLIPIADKIRYVHSLKEQAITISDQAVITKDDVPIAIDGMLYIKIVDPFLASYGIEDPIFAVIQLAQTTMRSEVGKMTLGKTIKGRKMLNKKILDAINDEPLRTDWGLECLGYWITDVSPPASVMKAMNLRTVAKLNKRAKILNSEAQRESSIKIADGLRNSDILKSEAERVSQMYRATGEAEAIVANAHATAKAKRDVSKAVCTPKGMEATGMRVAEQYIEAFGELRKKGRHNFASKQCSRHKRAKKKNSGDEMH